jgi:hypothetical protein
MAFRMKKKPEKPEKPVRDMNKLRKVAIYDVHDFSFLEGVDLSKVRVETEYYYESVDVYIVYRQAETEEEFAKRLKAYEKAMESYQIRLNKYNQWHEENKEAIAEAVAKKEAKKQADEAKKIKKLMADKLKLEKQLAKLQGSQ